jgi:hypothetical protein
MIPRFVLRTNPRRLGFSLRDALNLLLLIAIHFFVILVGTTHAFLVANVTVNTVNLFNGSFLGPGRLFVGVRGAHLRFLLVAAVLLGLGVVGEQQRVDDVVLNHGRRLTDTGRRHIFTVAHQTVTSTLLHFTIVRCSGR